MTRWHEHVAGYDVNHLHKLVQIPDTLDMDSEVPGIRNVVEAYYLDTLAFLDTTDDLILQKLNSPDPQKE